jgi:hypothetical protein
MTNNNDRSHSLYNIELVQDITPETAANYSGGASRLGLGSSVRFDSEAIGSDIVLHKDPNAKGQKLGISRASVGEVINIGELLDGKESTFNDTVSSITVNKGNWQFFTNVGGGDTGLLAPGNYNLGSSNDRITSVKFSGSSR